MPLSKAAIASSSSSRHAARSLYRSCLRSVKRIPEPDHRLEYEKYTRQGFRDKRKLVEGSRQAIVALEDAREQLERMNYYHSIREGKEAARQQQQKENSKDHIMLTENVTHITTNTATTITPTLSSPTIKMIHTWLEKALPQLSDPDKNHYTTCLLEDGFDSMDLLQKDLVPGQDLEFMKKGHQRAIRRTYYIEKENGMDRV